MSKEFLIICMTQGNSLVKVFLRKVIYNKWLRLIIDQGFCNYF